MNEPAAVCDHDWQWLDRPVFVFQHTGRPFNAYNCECLLCGAHTWAHGNMPDGKPVLVTLTPTTGRS